MATKKFYENYNHVVTPTSKNVVLEYKGDYSVYFGITVDISGKNAAKYNSNYENVSVKSGDDLIVKTIFISNSGSAKTVTTTIKDYFTNPYFDNNFTLESNLLKNQTYIINQNTDLGTNGLYSEKGDYANSSDFILASKYDNEQAFNLKNNYDDFVYDEKGKDNYVITSSSGRDYILEMAGNDKYSASNASNPHIRDLKGNDEYVAEEPDTRMVIEDYSGNDKYIAQDFATIITHDYKGNDEYWLYSHIASYIQDNSGNDKYTLLNAWVTTGANIIENRYGNDKYDIEKSIAVLIGDYSGKDEYKIKNIDTSSKNYESANFTIVDYSGNDKYELENISSREEQTRSHITDELGNDSYLATNVNYVSFYDKKGNDKYNFISGKNATIYDWLGKDTYTLKGTETEKLKNLTINDMDTSKKTASDKYILEKTDHVEITDNAGNDNYNIKESEYCTIEDYTGNDKYDVKDSNDCIINDNAGNDKYSILTCTDANITDGQGADSYTVKGSYNKKTKETTYVRNITIEDGSIENDTYYFDKVYGVPEVNTISDEGGSDKYSIKDTMYVSIKDNNGNDKYSFNGQIINTKIDDLSGIDTYSNNSKSELKCIFIDDKGAHNDTYKLNNVEGTINDDGGDNTFAINGSSDFYVTTSGLGNDKYTLQNRINGYIKDYDGEDTYTSKGKTTLWSFSISDSGTAADTYTLNGGNLLSITDEGGNNKFTISNCYESGITATGNGNDTYKYTNMSDCWIDDYDGNDNYNINKSRLSNIKDYAGEDLYKIVNTESGYITDSEGDDNYSIVKSTDINIEDYDGDDTYTVDIKGIRNGHYYIDDCGSGTDSLTISGLSAKNVVYLSDIDKNGKTTGDLIILDKANKSYVQINHFYNYDYDSGYILDEFDEGCIETIKAGKTTLNITSDIRNDINNIKGQIAGWLSSSEEYDSVIKVLNSGDKNVINELIAYCQG